MRMLGAVLILLSSFLFALQILREKKERIRALIELGHSLKLMRGELTLHASPLPDLLNTVARLSAGVSERLFREMAEALDRLGEESFAGLWREKVLLCCRCLPSEAREELIRLGSILGRFSLEDQLQGLERCSQVFSCKTEELDRSLFSFRRMTCGLCFSGGAFLVIILL